MSNIEQLWIDNKLTVAELNKLSKDEVMEFLSFLKYKINKTKIVTKKFNYHCLFSLVYSHTTMSESEFSQFYQEVIFNIMHSYNIGDSKKKLLEKDLQCLKQQKLDEVYLRTLFN